MGSQPALGSMTARVGLFANACSAQVGLAETCLVGQSPGYPTPNHPGLEPAQVSGPAWPGVEERCMALP